MILASPGVASNLPTPSIGWVAFEGPSSPHSHLEVRAAVGSIMAQRSGRRVLFVNPKSGGGTAERFDLVAECRKRGIVPVVMGPGDDVQTLAAELAVGAEVVGMAGGDGSQAAVATVASALDVPFVCVPAGTRNHFAADIGLDRRDVVGALDAFDTREERLIDMASVNGRDYLNIASMGLYAANRAITPVSECEGQDGRGDAARVAGPRHPAVRSSLHGIRWCQVGRSACAVGIE